jgi:hypothetical protein
MFSEATHMYPVARGDQFECTGSDLKEAVPAGIQTQSLKKKIRFYIQIRSDGFNIVTHEEVSSGPSHFHRLLYKPTYSFHFRRLRKYL